MSTDSFAKLPFPPPGPRRQVKGPLVAGALLVIGLFGLSNGLVIWLMEVFRPQHWGAFWVYATAGGMGAQLALLSFWSALGPGKAWLRMSGAAAVGVFWLTAWGTGYCLVEGWRGSREANLCLVAPMLLLAAQLPLWIMRIAFRWRLEEPEVGANDQRPPQMSIAGILFATALVGAALAAAKLGLSWAGSNNRPENWLFVGIACAICAAGSLVTLLPVVPLVLRTRPAVVGISIAVLYLLCVAVIAVLIGSAVSGMRMGRENEVVFSSASIYIGFTSGLILPLALLRISNYRLRWGREQAASAQPLLKRAGAVTE